MLFSLNSSSEDSETIELFFLMKLCLCIAEEALFSASGKNVLNDDDSANFPKLINEFDFKKLCESFGWELALLIEFMLTLLGLKTVMQFFKSPFCLGMTNSKVNTFLIEFSRSVKKF